MDELRIAAAIAGKVWKDFGHEPGARIIRIGLSIGELSGVDPDSLNFCFGEVAAGNGLDGVELVIGRAPRLNSCPACGITFPVFGFEFGCPSCYSTGTEPVGGREIIVSWVDLEEEEVEEAAMSAAAG